MIAARKSNYIRSLAKVSALTGVIVGAIFILTSGDAGNRAVQAAPPKADAPKAGTDQQHSTAGARKPERAKWSWNSQQAELTPTGDLKWKPQPFAFKPGPSIRYIDFEKGDDAKDGKTKETAWKHHPWDPSAAGAAKDCKGPQTYVFKRGVVYRGGLTATESGEAKNPIILTSDPAWGQGEAVFSGAEQVSGWKQGADHKDIPDKDKVWFADLNFAPRMVWVVKGAEVENVPLARTPNWKVSNPEDVLSEWWTWEQPQWWTDKNVTTVGGMKMLLGIDTKHLTQSEDFYKDAIVWSEWGIVMGTPFPAKIQAVDTAKKAVGFQGRWMGTSVKLITNNRYCLEDKPHYLDSAGEFWFEKKGDGGRLYIRLPGDADPTKAVVEAARQYNLIQDQASAKAPPRLDIINQAARDGLDTTGVNHITISGLTFQFTNMWWDLDFPPWMHKEVNSACIRFLGTSDDINISNCRFLNANKGIRIESLNDKVRIGSVAITDSDFQYICEGAINVGRGSGQLDDVKVLRNNLYMIGMRPYRQADGHALCINFPQTMEVAGNIMDRCYGSGIFVFGGKGSGELRDAPMSRHLIYNNRATNTLLAANDWGGIETWQGGPFYVFNNISGNANGYWNWAYNKDKPASGRLGFAYYLDGGFKNYLFNNVAWGISSDLSSPLCNQCAFHEAISTIENSFFNNTAYKFAEGSRWSPTGGRHFFLGNLFMDISSWVFMHGKLKEDKDTGPRPPYPYYSNAYGSNIFQAISPKQFAVFESDGRPHTTLESFRKALEERKPLAMDGGIMADSSPVNDAEKHDFRPKAGSAVIDKGVKMFVPWGLFRMVGEWNFRRNNEDPTILLDNHWYMTPYYPDRDEYCRMPVFNLKAVNVKAEDFEKGVLEDWTDGALKFNGKDQFATITNDEMTKSVTYKAGQKGNQTASGKDIATPDIDTSNFIIEAYFRTEANHTGGVIVAKMADAGYQLAVDKSGGVTLSAKAGAEKAELAGGVKVNDGKWHHVLAETDRAAKTATIYVDGKKAAEGPFSLGESASLSNGGDLFVGKNSEGNFFAGAMDFLRIARGNLKDAKTTIEELYDWEFDGPFLRDFTGREIKGKTRDAGAFELAE